MTTSAPATMTRALTLRAHGTAWSTIEAVTGVTEAAAVRYLAGPPAPKPRVPRPKAPPPGVKILTPRERYIESAAQAVSSFLGYTITAAQLRAPPRDHEESRVRFFAMAWLRWAYPSLSSPRIGEWFDVHHSTILHAEKRTRELYPTAPFCRRRPENLDERLAVLGLERCDG